jgi:hypothetical protein
MTDDYTLATLRDTLLPKLLSGELSEATTESEVLHTQQNFSWHSALLLKLLIGQ